MNLIIYLGFIGLNAIAFWLLEKKYSFGKAFFCDLIFSVTNPIIVAFILSKVLFYYFSLTGTWSLINLPLLIPEWQLWVLVILFADLWGYVWHLIYHHTFLWRLHFIHHSSRDLRWHSSLRFHPIEIIMTHSTLFIILGCCGIPYKNYVFLNIFIFVFTALSHSKVNWNYGFLGKMIVSPAYHALHHQESTQHMNLGHMFVIWDHLLKKSINPLQLPNEVNQTGNDSWIKLWIHPFRFKKFNKK
jgi:sterol desaturase/sphingolipid hydroxylase (fatty acid hydroxylase superfamily)